MKLSYLFGFCALIVLFAVFTTAEESITDFPSQPTPGLAEFPPMDLYKKMFWENLMYSGTDAIIAARSQSNPDYWYDWVRDSAITMGAVEILLGWNSTDILPYYQRYERFTQRQFSSRPNPGYDIRGDVKYEVNGEVFNGPWGRNQNDGPAQRASVRINYAHWFLARGQNQDAENLYRSDFGWGGIKWELDYVKTTWSTATFDIWEECQGYHYYTLMLSRKALYKGAVLAYILKDYDYAISLLMEAANINNAIPHHFNDKDGMIYPMINTVCQDDRWSMDSAVNLATQYGAITNQLMGQVKSISTAWYNGMCASGGSDSRCQTIKSYLDNWQQYGYSYWTQPQVHHSYNLFNLWKLSQWSRQNFDVAKRFTWSETFIARYANDRYSGVDVSRGNPWFLSNFATGSTWYQAGRYYRPENKDVYESNYSFYTQHYGMWYELLTPHRAKCQQFDDILRTLYQGQTYSVQKGGFQQCAAVIRDIFWARAEEAVALPFQLLGYANNIPEQLHRDSGFGVGAAYLTWSYSSLVYADYDRNHRNEDLP